jgi:hypothetical protein
MVGMYEYMYRKFVVRHNCSQLEQFLVLIYGQGMMIVL